MATECSALDKQELIHTWPFDLSVGNGGFYGSVKYYFGQNQLRRSILSTPEEECKFRYILKKMVMVKGPINCAIETGTYKGTATALLAHYAKSVITIDTHNYIDKYPFWIEYGVYEKIKSYLVTDERDKAELLSQIDFDFAFIDGDHTEAGVRSDFEMVRKCGRVLFHDYYEESSEFDRGAAKGQGIIKVVNSLPRGEVVVSRPFAYWERKENEGI